MMPDDKKKIICPDCGKEVETDDECSECGYPLRFHNYRQRVRAVEKREQEKAEQEANKNKKPEPKRRILGGALCAMLSNVSIAGKSAMGCGVGKAI